MTDWLMMMAGVHSFRSSTPSSSCLQSIQSLPGLVSEQKQYVEKKMLEIRNSQLKLNNKHQDSIFTNMPGIKEMFVPCGLNTIKKMWDIKGTEGVYMMLRHHQMLLSNQLTHLLFISCFLTPLPAPEDGFRLTQKA